MTSRIMVYSKVIRFPPAWLKRWSAWTTSPRGYRFSRGMSWRRSPASGEWSERARRNCSSRSASSRIPGTTPTVDTVMRRAPTPYPWFRMVRDGWTDFRLARGSPIPMYTMLVMAP